MGSVTDHGGDGMRCLDAVCPLILDFPVSCTRLPRWLQDLIYNCTVLLPRFLISAQRPFGFDLRPPF